MRVSRLALRFAWSSRGRFALLVLLVTVGMVVLLVVTELSRVSGQGLDEAISEDVGETGTYTIELRSDFGLRSSDLANLVDSAVGNLAAVPLVMVTQYPAVQAECPPFNLLGRPRLLVLADAGASPLSLPFGEGLPPGTAFCLAGQSIPQSALYVPTKAEMSKWATGLFIRPEYADLALSSTRGRIIYSFTVITGRSGDLANELTGRIVAALSDVATRYGSDTEGAVSVNRRDSADSVRRASSGVRAVYGAIGWGVLILAGLGLLIAETIIVRDRMWFFGLSRALGARRRHIAALVVADVLVVLVLGTLLALGVAAVAQPVVAQFARDAFQVDAHLLHGDTMPRLMTAGMLVLILAAAYPAVRAIRQDPLDVLEPKQG